MKRSILLTLAASVMLAFSASAGELSGPAPDFTLQTRDGETVSLSDFAGEVVMINFWATWCGPCREEMPHLEALHRRYSSLGFRLLGVNVEEDTKNMSRFLADTPVTFEILLDPASDVSKLYDVVAMPSTVMVDRNGQMRYIHHGYQPGYENEYLNQIRALLRE